MLFRDLLNLPYNSRSNIIDVSALRQALPAVPDAVLGQVLSDHGRKEDFQRQYGTIDLLAVRWRQLTLSAAELARASVNRDFENWVNQVSKRASRFAQTGWKCVDMRDAVVSHWQKHSTWVVPPVFLQDVVNRACSLERRAFDRSAHR